MAKTANQSIRIYGSAKGSTNRFLAALGFRRVVLYGYRPAGQW